MKVVLVSPDFKNVWTYFPPLPLPLSSNPLSSLHPQKTRRLHGHYKSSELKLVCEYFAGINVDHPQCYKATKKDVQKNVVVFVILFILFNQCRHK